MKHKLNTIQKPFILFTVDIDHKDADDNQQHYSEVVFSWYDTNWS